MITERFLNSCFSIILNEKGRIRKDKGIFRDILDIMGAVFSPKNGDIPITLKNKVDFLCNLCKMKLEGRENENAVDNLLISEKFKSLADYIHMKTTEELTDAVISDNVKQIRMRKQMISMYKNYPTMNAFMQTLKDGSFDSIDDFIYEYETMVKTLYTTYADSIRSISIEAVASLDLEKDSYEAVTKTILEKYERKNATQTGYPILDNEVLKGGFEKSRLYIFGGGSGSGKSTLMDNFIANNAMGDLPMSFDTKVEDANIKKVFIYITMENTIEESLMRIYQIVFNKTIYQAMIDIQGGKDIKAAILERLKANNATVIMKYFPASTISATDLMTVLDDVITDYGKPSIKGLYVDYLDLLTCDMKYDQYRLELGQVTLSLKTIAVEYNIPVITLTQLNRSVYQGDPKDMNLGMMSESTKKIDHADFIGLLVQDRGQPNIVHLKIGKNRSGRANVSIDFNVDFSKFKFISGHLVSNNQKADAISDSQNCYSGIAVT